MTQKSNESGLELVPSTAQPLVIELFERQSLWANRDLARAVRELHASRGGIQGRQRTIKVVKKVLTRLRRDGVIKNAGFAQWEAASKSKHEHQGARNDGKNLETRAEKIIGTGSESIYVYFNENDRKLAKFEAREYWECKVGRTNGSVVARISDQGIKTALAREPVVGLVIRIDDSASLEKILHGLLTLTNRQIKGGCGSEWFLTSPWMIEEFYKQCMRIVPTLQESIKAKDDCFKIENKVIVS